MNINHITTIEQIQSFLLNTAPYTLKAHSKQEVYEWMNQLLKKVKYHGLKKAKKRIVKEFISRITGYNTGHIKRLISKHKTGELVWKKWQKGCFSAVYTREDITLLHSADEVHRLSGQATKNILRREYEVFGKEEYRKLSNISVAHIYNLRGSITYQRMGKVFDKTKPRNVSIGVRKKPKPNGKPGYLRVDSVHQGDKGKAKGLYWVNIVDEVTQSEFVFCVSSISQKDMEPVLKALVKLCPFTIINFHSDNGSEYINKVVADLLNRLHINQTKSRSRKSNDNALAESKNGSIVRKHFGYVYIPATGTNAHLLTTFCINWLNPYLNYHRPCGFASTTVDKRGKEKNKYKTDDYKTPYEKLKSLPNAEKYLKQGITFEELDKIAYNMSDTEFAGRMNSEKQITFKKLQFRHSPSDIR